MRVFVYACEGYCQGLHGVEDFCVMEVSDDPKKAQEEINEWGTNAVVELIYSYFNIEDHYFEDGEECLEESPYFENCSWYGVKIKDEITLSVRELDRICADKGATYFVDEYCDKNCHF